MKASQDLAVLNAASAKRPRQARRREKERPLPDDWMPSDLGLAWLHDLGFDAAAVVDLYRRTQAGRLLKRWTDASFRWWFEEERRFGTLRVGCRRIERVPVENPDPPLAPRVQRPFEHDPNDTSPMLKDSETQGIRESSELQPPRTPADVNAEAAAASARWAAFREEHPEMEHLWAAFPRPRLPSSAEINAEAEVALAMATVLRPTLPRLAATLAEFADTHRTT
jgi:hypothetical protein